MMDDNYIIDPTRKGILAPGTSASSQLGKSVVNLSSLTLTQGQLEALEKGLTFCPTPRSVNIVKVWDGLEKFCRRLRLKKHFDGSIEQEDPYKAKFRNPSTWSPSEGADTTLDLYIKSIKMDTLLQTPQKIKHHNLTKTQYTGIKEICDNPNIILKKADKGSAVVCMNTSDYVHEILRQLSNKESYTKLNNDPTEAYSLEIREVLFQLLNEELIDDNMMDYLDVDKARPGRFYILPKIHKPFIPGRPICSSNNHPTERISEFVDYHIRKYVTQLPSYVRDTQDFINKIKAAGTLTEDTLLVTMDVSSLYTSIPNNMGIESVLEHINGDPAAPIPAGYMEKLMKLILNKNHFEFNGNLYLQIGGTAMGTRFAPSFANLFMGKFEHDLLRLYDKHIKLWLRFIDDIFLLFEYGEDELNKFVALANGLVPSIKFTHEFSHSSIVFLDTEVVLDNTTNKLYTRLHLKPTDTRDFLHFSSSHPRSQKLGGPYGQFLRIRRICTKDWDFNLEARSLLLSYLRRGYPRSNLEAALHKASKFTQEQLLVPKTKTPEARTVIALEFNPANPNIFQSVRKFWPLLSTNRYVGHLFSLPPLCANRRCPNLRDKLVSATCNYPALMRAPIPNPPHTTCGNITCKYCKLIVKSENAKSTFLDINYKAKLLCRTSCLSTNVIYLITCLKCECQYVGETKRQLRRRMYEHLKSIQEHGKPGFQATPVSVHFNTACKRPAKLNFQILETIRGNPDELDTTLFRKKREKWWILSMRTLDPLGINVCV